MQRLHDLALGDHLSEEERGIFQRHLSELKREDEPLDDFLKKPPTPENRAILEELAWRGLLREI